MEFFLLLILVIALIGYIKYRLRIGRLIQYNMDMGPPDPDAIEYERGFVCIYYGKGRGGASTVLPRQKAECDTAN